MSEYKIRPVRPEEAEAWMEMRLEALQTHPRAFGDSYEEAAARPIADLKARLAAPGPDVVLGVFVDGALLGTAAFTRDTALKMRHKALMGAVYVRPALRGTGAADALVGAIVAHARQHCAVLRAVVAPTNETARRLYFRHGFKTYGIEPRGQRLDGVDYDEELIAIAF